MNWKLIMPFAKSESRVPQEEPFDSQNFLVVIIFIARSTIDIKECSRWWLQHNFAILLTCIYAQEAPLNNFQKEETKLPGSWSKNLKVI